MTGKKKHASMDMWFCAVVLFLLTLIMVKLEMRKGDIQILYSDFATHSAWAVGEFTEAEFDKFYAYPLWHLAVKAVNLLLPIGREWAAAFVTACCIGLTAAVLHRFLWKRLKDILTGAQVCALDISLMILTAVYLPWLNKNVYLGQGSPTIWHNPTNMAVKPLALLIFLLFAEEYRNYENAKTKRLFLMSALLLLSCFVKPSFIQGFLPAVVLFLLIELFRTKGKSFLFSLKMAAVFIPSGFYFLYQFLAVFGEATSRSIAVSPFEVMLLYTEHPLASILQAVAFPVFVLCALGWKRIRKDRTLVFAVLFYLVTMLEYILLIEVQEAASGNFEWASQLAMFIFFAVTAVRFYQTKWKTWIFRTGNVVLACHVLSGIYYYLGLIFWIPGQC